MNRRNSRGCGTVPRIATDTQIDVSSLGEERRFFPAAIFGNGPTLGTERDLRVGFLSKGKAGPSIPRIGTQLRIEVK